MVPIPPLNEQVRIELLPVVMVSGTAPKLEIIGDATMTHAAVPAWDVEPAALVTTQANWTVPEAPAVKVTWLAFWPAVIVPPVTDQA
jgi:hypothetical protein